MTLTHFRRTRRGDHLAVTDLRCGSHTPTPTTFAACSHWETRNEKASGCFLCTRNHASVTELDLFVDASRAFALTTSLPRPDADLPIPKPRSSRRVYPQVKMAKYFGDIAKGCKGASSAHFARPPMAQLPRAKNERANLASVDPRGDPDGPLSSTQTFCPAASATITSSTSALRSAARYVERNPRAPTPLRERTRRSRHPWKPLETHLSLTRLQNARRFSSGSAERQG